MSLVRQANELFPYVFHPITVVGAGMLVLIHHEWARRGGDRAALRRRIAGFLGAGLLALVPTVAYFAITGENPIAASQGNSWKMDALVASGLFIASGTVWYLWRRADWGRLVPGAAQALAAVTIPYAALSPVWNVSGHVIVALMPTLYLALVDRKFWPGLLVPVLMVPNRIYLDAHTWAQSIGGFLIAAAIVFGLYRWQTSGPPRREPGSAA